jgi:hypothetical protein
MAAEPGDNRKAALAIALAIALVSVSVIFARSGARDLDGTLYYHALHFRNGTLSRLSVRARNLASGSSRTLFSGGLCGETSYSLDPSGRRLAVCPYDPRSATNHILELDLSSGRTTHIERTRGRFAIGWSLDGELLLLEQGRRAHDLYAVSSRSERLLYRSVRFVVAAIEMTPGTLAVMRSTSSVEACDAGRCLGGEIVLVREGRVVETIADAAGPVIALDRGEALLFMRGRTSPELRILRSVEDGFVEEPTGIEGIFGTVDNGGAALSADGRIALAGDSSGRSGILVLEPRTHKFRFVASGVAPLAWTPHGGLVYSSRDMETIHLNDLRGHDRVIVRGEDVRAITVL